MNLLDRYIINCRARLTVFEQLQYRFLSNDKPFLVGEGFNMIINPRDKGLSRQLWCRGFREPVCTSKYKEIIEPDMIVADVGSNIGYYPLVALGRLGEKGKVYCFEPIWENYSLLKQNLRLNGYNSENYECFNAAVVHHDQSWSYMDDGGGHFNRCRISDKGVRVPCVNFDREIGIRSFHPNVIRMDVEGYEYELLHGMGNALRSCEYLYVEMHPYLIKKQYDDGFGKLVDYLNSCNLFPFYIVKEYGAYLEEGRMCDRYDFNSTVEKLGILDESYTCGFGLFMKKG